MSIGFVCEHCGQKLTVNSSRAGQRGNCPKCRKSVVVPSPAAEEKVAAAKESRPPPSPAPVRSSTALPSPPPPPPARSSPASPPPAPVSLASSKPDESEPAAAETKPESDDRPAWLANSDRQESPWIYVDSAVADPIEKAPPQGIDLSRVSIPRFVIFTQGILLGVVALVAFALGLLASGGGGAAKVGSGDDGSPCVVSGKVEYLTSGGTKFPDEGAVVLLFPQAERPATEERAVAIGLRPEDPPPTAAVPGLQMLRLMGASYTRTDVAGQFRVTLPRGGKYYLFIVSHHASRRKGREISRADLAAIGRYITPAGDLIGDRRYRWRAEEFQRDAEVLVVLE